MYVKNKTKREKSAFKRKKNKNCKSYIHEQRNMNECLKASLLNVWGRLTYPKILDKPKKWKVENHENPNF